MLFTQDVLHGIAAGRVTLAFRRWRKAPPPEGATLRTPVGVVALTRITAVDEDDISPDDVSRTGLSADALRLAIAREGRLWRIELRLVGADPRVALRAARPTADEQAVIEARLARLDAAAPVPWTAGYLRLIADQPATAARVLAAQVGVEIPVFKRRVRQLKELGLTESLEVGYRLSPRGAAVCIMGTP